MPDSAGPLQPERAELATDERARRADLWEAGADERQRLADERERLADERETLADERERLADRQDGEFDRRESDRLTQLSSGDPDETAEAASAEAAVRRAHAAMRRAEAQLLRAQRVQARALERGARRLAGTGRSAAAGEADSATGEECAWLAERRDFVAADRENLADRRDGLADERDEVASLREGAADARERESLDREHRLDRRDNPRRASRRTSTSEEYVAIADQRARGTRQRDATAARRSASATDRVRAAGSWGPQAYGPMLLASFADIARSLIGSDDLTAVLPQVLKYTVGVVAGCDGASVTQWRNGRATNTVATGPAAAELDDVQFGTGLGPALDALHSDLPICVPDLARSTRWPVLAATAAQLNIASILCLGLSTYRPDRWTPLGTFTLYGATPDAFTDEDQEFVPILAAYVAVAVAMAIRHDEVDRREAALHRGLSTRDLIGQAKGILMERQRLSAGDAFDVLRRASQRLNVKLTDVAQHLTETGELPDQR